VLEENQGTLLPVSVNPEMVLFMMPVQLTTTLLLP